MIDSSALPVIGQMAAWVATAQSLALNDIIDIRC